MVLVVSECTLPLATIVITLGLWRLYSRRKKIMSVLERNGIPGPKPHLIRGNMKEYDAMPNVLWDSNLIQMYGPIVGYYLGAKPVVLISDQELIHKIQRTDGNLFLERPRRVPGGINPDPHRALMLGNLPVEQWKALRKILAPSFNSPNLRAMSESVIALVDKMKRSFPCNTEFDFYEKFKHLTLDIIGKTAFGIDSNIMENPDDPLMTAVASEFTKSTSSLLVQIYLCFPEISFILHPIRIWIEKIRVACGWSASSALWTQGRLALASRKDYRPDLLQKLIGSKLSENEIVANSVLFFEAAYETLSSALAFTIHLLVHNQSTQDDLRQELQDYMAECGKFDYEIVSRLPLMDRVIKESLRLFPPQTTFIGRAPSVDYVFVNSSGKRVCTIPKGTHTQVALYQIHHSDEFWVNPAKFDPDRFLNIEKNCDCWQPFGAGKRECIGKGFAIFVLKLVLAKIFYDSKLEISRMTEPEKEVEIHFKTATMTPKKGSWAKNITAEAA